MTTADQTTLDHRLGLFIDGRDVPRAEVITVSNPARTAETVGTVAVGTAADVDAAVAAAERAQPGWEATPVEERLALFAEIADRIDAVAEDLADLTARENGSARAIIRRELQGAAGAWRAVGTYLAERLAPEEHHGDAGERVRVERRPFGVVGCIVPWNAPLLLTANKIAPALAAGNAIVLKPSPLAPLGASTIGRIAAGVLPAGVVNVLNGGGETGAALVGHPRVRKVSFTGGGETAHHILRQAAANLTGVHLELGGNDPALVLDDADLPGAADGIVASAFRRAGQVCFAAKRVYVPRRLAEEFRARLVESVDRIAVGDPLDPRAGMGPLNNAGQLEKVAALVAGAREAGRDVRELGTVLDPEGWSGGHFHRPTLVLDAEHGDELVRQEQFGPVLPVVAYDDLDEAVRMANDTEYGLCSSVWTADPDRAQQVSSRIEAGMTIVNSHLFSPTGTARIPFGGWKRSGIGWEGSPHGIEEYLQFHSTDFQGHRGPAR
ncbi:aldehyde dehydrogenase family protein [Citricoccus sp. SGAir0253]|uniref:aldehyde dehydrogenase family protein n=1 Tax=Citricoccus sp. SGAir0253 TaxID=2567881 RepID=UPI0010CCD76C|nr:aldehyde dehydrogenase family protein [Citricoccus sp. SGAir0253]QCU77564.1 aldehyde dehydrogenase family protein [Citricoccus sp. SGAir0253]